MRHRASLDGLRKIAPVPFANSRLCLDRRANIALDSRRRNLPKAGVGGSRLEAISVSHLLYRPDPVIGQSRLRGFFFCDFLAPAPFRQSGGVNA